MAVRIEFFVRC